MNFRDLEFQVDHEVPYTLKAEVEFSPNFWMTVKTNLSKRGRMNSGVLTSFEVLMQKGKGKDNFINEGWLSAQQVETLLSELEQLAGV
jgi:hypothetical protein